VACQLSLVIDEAANGGAQVTFAYGTVYLSLEVWQYGGSNCPQLLYFFDAVAAGMSALDLYQPRLLNSP
jgi:hypothetical protein